jgi:heterokaryon incompatibility protein (HET)
MKDVWLHCGSANDTSINSSNHTLGKKSQHLGKNPKADEGALEELNDLSNNEADLSISSNKESSLCSSCSHLPLDKLGMQVIKKSKHVAKTIMTDELGNTVSFRSFLEVLQAARVQSCLFCAIIMHMSLPALTSFLEEAKDFYFYSTKDLGAKDINADDFITELYSNFGYVYRMAPLQLRSDQSDTQSATLNQFVIELRQHHPKTPGIGNMLHAFRFQSCNSEPVMVHGQCDSNSLFTPNIDGVRPYSVRIRPERADLRLIRAWKDHCLGSHSSSCSPSSGETRKLLIRLIDVNQRCIIDSSGTEKWVALSYVWGGANKMSLHSGNIEEYRKPDSLTVTLPATIKDALAVTQGLGEKYLWVDSLCIIQDCAQDKIIHIPKMRDIYSHSVVTIIAASGSNAEAGLPGIRESILRSEQYFFQFGKSFRLGDYGIGMMMDPAKSRDWDYLTGSPWSGRAWTFQERLLSKRILVFTPDLIYWECQQAMWREDCFGELPSGLPKLFAPSFGDDSFWNHLKISTLWGSHPFDAVNTYRQIISHYTSLQMSCQEDGLNAIAGILSILEKRSGHGFFWGLPTAFFSAVLAWESHSSGDSTISSRNQRRTARHVLNSTHQRTLSCQFPSWSWVGWTGRVWFPPHNKELSRQSDLIFYKFIESKTLSLIEGTLRGGNNSHPFWTRPGWNVTGEVTVCKEHIPDKVASGMPQANTLAFWTDVADVTISWQEVDVIWTSYHSGSKVRAEVSQKDVRFTSTWSQVPVGVKSFSSEHGSFIIIGMNSHNVNALLVSWINGVAYRRGLANIKESDWTQLRQRVWKPIFLA